MRTSRWPALLVFVALSCDMDESVHNRGIDTARVEAARLLAEPVMCDGRVSKRSGCQLGEGGYVCRGASNRIVICGADARKPCAVPTVTPVPSEAP